MKLTKQESKLIDIPYIDLTEQEKLIRKNGILKLKDTSNKQNKYKKKQMIKNKITTTDKILVSKNKSLLDKRNSSKQLGIFLIKNGKEKLGIEYFYSSIKYYETLKGNDCHNVRNDYVTYYKLLDRVNRIIKGKKQNMQNN